MTDHLQTILTIVASACALGALMWRRLDPVVKIVRYLHGEDGDERRGVPSRPGILERQTVTEKRLEEQRLELASYRDLQELRDSRMQSLLGEIVAQLRNNGGSSVKDLVEKTLQAVTSSTT